MTAPAPNPSPLLSSDWTSPISSAHAHYTKLSAPSPPRTILHHLVSTLPVRVLLFQLLTSVAFTALSTRLSSTRTTRTLVANLSLPSPILLTAAFSLFILLSFLVSESQSRRRRTQLHLNTLHHSLRHVLRKLRLTYPAPLWHPNAHSRIIAHLAAIPLSLPLHFLPDHTPPADLLLSPLLHPSDISTAFSHPSPPHHLLQTVRAYFTSIEDDSPLNFPALSVSKTPAGSGTRFHINTLLDTAESSLNALHRLHHHQLAHGYLNHLHLFLYIWAILLPISLIPDSRWFTPLWSILITYAIATLFYIARSLARPFHPSPTAIPLSRLCARFAADLLQDALASNLSYVALVKPSQNSAHQLHWLSQPLPSNFQGYSPKSSPPASPPSAMQRMLRFRRVHLPFGAMLALLAAAMWAAFIVFLTWGLSRKREVFRQNGDRWWSVQVPLSSTATGYASLGLFLLLTFWTMDAYNRLWDALHLWQTRVRPRVDALAHAVCLLMHEGYWHERDHERVLSYLAALPVAMKLHLRGEGRDGRELGDILGYEEMSAVLRDGRELPMRCTDVLMAYLDSADAAVGAVLSEKKRPFLVEAFTVQENLWEIDRALWESVALKEAPLAPAFTMHVRVFAALWLAMLTMTIVQHDGFLTFLYVLPIAYSIVNLVTVGLRLNDPFGYDEEDVPLDLFCQEIQDSVHRIYLTTRGGSRAVVHTEEEYDRSLFVPKAQGLEELMKNATTNSRPKASVDKNVGRYSLKKLRSPWSKIKRKWRSLFNQSRRSDVVQSSELPYLGNHVRTLTLKSAIRNLIARFPAISFTSYLAVTLWSVAAVYTSWGLSTLWEGEDRGNCLQWCSPIDVQGSVLADIGFALFLILTFRAADALSRFDNGAVVLQDLALQMRGMALDFVQAFPTGFFHTGDKERVLAHIVQIPLCLRDMLLENGHGRESAAEGLLSNADRKRFADAASPIEHLFETIEAYILVEDSTIRRGWDLDDDFRSIPPIIGPQLGRLVSLRGAVSRLATTKRFAVVPSYRRHERIFTYIWLTLLPLSMTADTGFFTILWAPIISYGVLILEDISGQLVDPFGCDVNDLPIQELCNSAANAALDAVHAAGWDTDKLCAPPAPEIGRGTASVAGVRLRGKEVAGRFMLPSLDFSDSEADNVIFDGHAVSRTKRSLFTHLIFSTPWFSVLAVFLWAVGASLISYATRNEGDNSDTEWWRSTIAITADVVNGASFGAFSLLGFLVSTAYARYERGGGLLEGRLRSACHALAANIHIYYRDGSLHVDDKKRLVGLVAAIPLLFRAELRGSRDIREVGSLMTSSDLAQVSCGDSMVLHCTAVIRAWLFRVVNFSEQLLHREPSRPTTRTAFVRTPISTIEECFQEAMFLKNFHLSPVFRTLTKTLLAIWFMLLPFILFELSGWLTVLWSPLIAFGILGMYSIAIELQDPFGTDLNDIDTDRYSHAIVKDVLYTHHFETPAFTLLTNHDTPHADWTKERLRDVPDQQPSRNGMAKSRWSNLKRGAYLAATIVPFWKLMALAGWAAAIVGLTSLVRSRLDVENCSGQWFCGGIAISSDIQEYVGFALFLLLGFRLTDSHNRYVRAQELWHEGIIGNCRLISNRFLESCAPGYFHEGDLDRICGHIAAVPIVLAASLRTDVHCSKRLQSILGERDIQKIMKSQEPVSFCLDVIRSYLFYTETLSLTAPERNGLPEEIYFNVLLYVESLQNAAFECRRVARVPIPFGYVSHLRIFMGIYLAILPIGLVAFTGWLAVVWFVLISYGVLGVQGWADELADPFGCDYSDLPLGMLRDQAVDAVKANMPRFPQGAISLVDLEERRQPFPSGASNRYPFE